MRLALRYISGLAAAALLGLLAAAPAAAEFGPPRLVSKSVAAQAREASLPVISEDGRYVAFVAVMEGGRQGVFEADLQSGLVSSVETGAAPERATAAEPAATATAPSISAEGRFVAFTTKASLDPLNDPSPDSEDVYVADMSTSPPTYALASVEPGGTTALTTPSHAAPRVALSANGREVAFVSGDQVYARNLDTDQTTLVSVVRNELTGAMEPGVPVPGGAVVPDSVLPRQNVAAISADGSTVAWPGGHVTAQVPLSAAEAQTISGFDSSPIPWNEPLWRRIADGPEAPTRRIVGGSPLVSFASAETDHGAVAQGWVRRAGIDGVPQLSANGYAVALIGTPTEAANLYLADMSPGIDRTAGVRQLTRQVAIRPAEEGRVVNVEPNVPRNGHVWDVAIAPDGKRVAFTTARQQFPLAPPNLVTAPPAQLGLVELYEIDFEDESLRRVTHGYTSLGEPSLPPAQSTLNAEAGAGAAAPSFAGGGKLLAFASEASNLVEGDGNDAGDVFAVEDVIAPRGSVNGGGAAPGGIRSRASRRLVLSAFSMADGRVRLVVVPPAKGSLRAQAAAKLGGGKRSHKLATRRAKAKKAAKPVSIVLALPRRLRKLAGTDEGVYATAQVWFKAPKSGKLHASTPIRFHVHKRSHRGKS